MNAVLKKKTEEWMQLERKTNEQRREADIFYQNNLMSLIEKDYQRRNKKKLFEKVDYLIMSVGTSYEPLVLNINLLQPGRILFLYTEKSEPTLNRIVNYCRLEVTRYQKEKVTETDPLTLYKEIKNVYLEWNKPERIYIDFTGGTKAMATAAAMAGALIDVQLIYLGCEEYLIDFRKPNPGTENLYFIDNPISVFGDLEIGKAMTLFEQFNYSGAKGKLEKLKENVPEPDVRQQLDFAYMLAGAYEAWDALDFETANDYMKRLNQHMTRDSRTHQTFLMMDFRNRFLKQGDILSRLSHIPEMVRDRRQEDILSDKDLMSALMFTMLQNAMVRERQEKYDMASLLMYRLLEMIEQRRLMEYNLYASHMDYANLAFENVKLPGKVDLEVIRENLVEIKEQMFGKQINRYLPDQISLLDGYMLLLALGDEISMVPNGRHITFIKKLRQMVYLRNNSIFAHGLGPVGRTDYTSFRDFVIGVLTKYCELEGISMRQYTEDMLWISPLHSKYYTSIGR
jgi:CRISPR-associated protein (TIGR02710 family)